MDDWKPATGVNLIYYFNKKNEIATNQSKEERIIFF